ncbi:MULTISPECIES: hypothetical protein [unclassified Rhizobium]|jgi:hypothetical protein|uniref:hypothetical protein n=1 Tax=unclassified Rhizobium TaxID=2613769 RepID=UPI000645B8F7|nr:MULTISPECIES: hypothetical protein [unclassified Rhizobium]MBN8951325.1 hypothetical protein [Rhizobium tropici]OJY74852.1 MAG: hypothetical protein BGP09_34070 [Rhizobium sp. 60-20]RKD66628.1 hypothetical protein BJ928_106153 [Rhizobium sp. WW_1]
MSELKIALDEAAGEGIISSSQAERLLPYLAGKNIGVLPAGRGLSASRFPDDPNPLEDTEAPRFVRGFHDVLITIGVIVLLIGLWGLANRYAPVLAIVVLAEILVRRQRLALPAVVLTVALVVWVFYTVVSYVSSTPALSDNFTIGAIVLVAPFPLSLALFYWRYRVPLSLALFLFSLFGLFLAAVFYVAGTVTGSSNVPADYPIQTMMILLVTALGSFALAMRYDLSDPQRVTRRSDVAFWLHLATAPALLYSTILLALRLELASSGIVFTNLTDALFGGYLQAVTVLVAVLVMMLIGLIIDRRAFVTAGLVSLGLATAAILRHNDAGLDKVGFLVLMIVGLVVLVIGIGWTDLRRIVVRRLPASMQARLPALR